MYRICIVLIIIKLFFGGQVLAEDLVGGKWVFGAAPSNNSIGGDMDGATTDSRNGAAETLPILADGSGIKLTMGLLKYRYHCEGEIVPNSISLIGCSTWRGSDSTYGLELSLNISNHDATYANNPRTTTARYLGFNIDYLKPFEIDQFFKPVVLLGIGLGSVSVDNGSIGFTTEKATVFQRVIRYGVGLHIPVARNYVLEIMSIQYDGSYTSIKGASDESKSVNFKARGNTNTIGIKIIF